MRRCGFNFGSIGQGFQLPSLLCLILVLSAPPAMAGQLDDQVIKANEKSSAGTAVQEKKDDDSISLVVVPVPVLDPTLGAGIAPAALLTFPAGDHPDQPRSTIGAVAAYTNNQSWIVGAGLQLYLDGDRWRVGLQGGYGVLNLDYYGTSSDSIFFDNPVGFDIKGSVVEATLQRRIADHFFLGALVRRVDAKVDLDGPIDLVPSTQIDLDLAGLGLVGTYDTRDNTWFPEAGSYANASFIAYSSTFGFDRDFGTLEVDYARYWTLQENLVFAAQARGAHAGDNAPFFMLPYLNFRGFPAGQYLNSTALQAQGEFRWMFWERFGAVAFGGTGVVAESLGDLGDGSDAYGVGAGLRYRVSQEDRMNIGLDLAYGSSDDVAVYFRIGEAF